MTRVVLRSKVGKDGVLAVTVAMDPADADREVKITVDPIEATPPTEQGWKQFIHETAGRWLGDFERPEQGEFERRDPLS